jgi:hypothetical protein
MYGHVCETGGTREVLPPRHLNVSRLRICLNLKIDLRSGQKSTTATNKIKDPERRKVVLLRDLRGARLCCGLALLYVGV